MKPWIKYYWPAILWALFVFTLCAVDLGPISKNPIFFPGFDKLVHCGFFFVLVILLNNGIARQLSITTISYKWLIIITVVAILYGGIIELLQLSVFTWRSGEWGDLFADSVGAFMGDFGIIVTIGAINYVKK